MKEAVIIGIVLVGLYLFMQKSPHLTALDNSMPNTRDVPQCPLGANRRNNGLDCKIKGDRFAL
jgi:hypothetical protein